MASDLPDIVNHTSLSRRALLTRVGLAAGAAVVAPRIARAQTGPMAPPSTVTTPPRDFGPNGAPTTYFTDPDVLSVDPMFNGIAQPNSAIQRLWTGALWAEGPAWSGQGRYLVFSDIPNNRQMRWVEDTGRVSVFRMPSNNSNGNTFDFQGRQLSCEHLTRRVVRYEHDGSITILAESFEGKRLNSPNDVVPHPDGSYWFTDPPYGGQLYEGAPDAAGGPSNQAGRLKNRLGQAAEIGSTKRELPTNCYRIDPSGKIDLVVTEQQVPDPNGLCFSPDYKKLYIASTGKGPGDTGPGRQGRHPRLRRRERQQALQPEALLRLHGGRRQVRAGRAALRRRRQRVGVEQRGPLRRLQRRPRVHAGGEADRPHPAPGDLRQRLLRRAEAESPVHGRQPVAVRRVREHPGGRARLDLAPSPSAFASPALRPGCRARALLTRARRPVPSPGLRRSTHPP